jgi:peptidoglycan/LPS O-acetylase OafA/YrhL
MLALFFMPLAQMTVKEITYFFNPFGMALADGTYIAKAYLLTAAVLLVMVYNLVIIFYFKNRKIQIKLAKLNGIVLAMLIGLVVLSIDSLAAVLSLPEMEANIEYGFGTYLLFIPLMLNYLSIKAIRKDEELVRSADRLR